MSRPVLLIVDDDDDELDATRRIFRNEPYEVLAASNGRDALEVLTDRAVAVLLTDLKMPGMDGQELLKRAKEIRPDVQVVVLTGYGTVAGAVDALHAGATDFLEKPLDVATARARVRKALEKYELQRQNTALREQVDDLYGLENMVGSSPAMQDVYRKIRRVAPTATMVLILGESGTGKELVAHAIHALSPRKGKRFLPFNCAAVTRELVESELFGYNRGAFTGAVRDKPGYFEEANGGTLFLDEIAEMTLEAQAKLLRVLEDRQIMRVGSARPVSVDVRILAATNRNLREWVQEGKFREDLYHRLMVFPIELPPLRARREDIPALAEFFLQRAIQENGLSPMRWDADALDALQSYEWKGNVRELRNLVQRLVLTVDGAVIRRADLPETMTAPDAKAEDDVFKVGLSMGNLEREAILRTLAATGGNKTQAAKLLGIGLRTLYRKLEAYGIKDDEST
jgi:two-component system response regulator HydG